jgi:hypothetical protein
MASKATPRRRKVGARASTVTRMCSINATGVIFVNTSPLEVSSELTLTIQTTVLGSARDWTVQGWVVECSMQESGYQVTMLFSDLPKGLSQVLALASGNEARAYPMVTDAGLFGLN